MEETNKGLKTQIEEITKWKKELEGGDKKKSKMSLKEVLSFVIASLFVGYFAWIFTGLTYGIIIGIAAGLISLFITNTFFSDKWKMPFKYRILGKKKKREGYVVAIKVGLNGAISFEKIRLDEQVALGEDNIPHTVYKDDVLIWKNKIPMVILPEWSERAWSPREHYQKTEENNESSKGWQYIMNFLKKNQIKEKKEFKTGTLIIGGIVVIGLIWYLIKSGAFS